MVKVITYGTYDLLHYGHIRLLERAKKLGDYLIVGVTSDEFDRKRGKINVKQSLMERIENVKKTGLADLIVVEEYDGQKIDDIKKYDVDIFTVGSDWVGKFDYLKEYCEVVYLERTEGISSSEIRSEDAHISMGILGNADSAVFQKYCQESTYVNGLEMTGACIDGGNLTGLDDSSLKLYDTYEELLANCDTVFVVNHPSNHYQAVKKALQSGKHVLCESPIAIGKRECEELFDLADKNKLILMEAIKTAYSTAYNRFLLMVKNGAIGEVVSIDSTCTSLRDIQSKNWDLKQSWNSICAWGPTALLPILQIFGVEYTNKHIISSFIDDKEKYDSFSKIDICYPDAVATVKVGKGVKAEGDLVVSGTKGYVYIPAPWWKTDYFEIRYENPEDNKRFFYQLEGEGIRHEFVAFLHSIRQRNAISCIARDVSVKIADIIDDYYKGVDCSYLKAKKEDGK